jgi:uncharacterized protein with PIN domain
MLGSLARKLRALGFDASYYRAGGDSEILRLASRERRIVLTADRGLASGPSGKAKVILIEGAKDPQRISSLSRKSRDAGVTLERGPPLCSICGGELVEMPRSEALGHVPPSVAVHHRLFTRCEVCGHFYWRGSHWKKLRSLAKRLEEK